MILGSAFAVDTDADGLDDQWEMSQFGDLNQDGTGDSDGDGYSNEQEETFGLDANVAGGVPGYLLHEMWTGLSGIDVEDLVDTEEFRQAPNVTELLLGVESSPGIDNYGSRFRGTITAPVTGSYTFWESGDDGVELWISSDDRKFLRQRVAWHSGNTGQLVWDKFSTQQSAPISLQAGQIYYLEALHKEESGGDYMALAWSYEADDLVNWALEPEAVATQISTVAGGVASRAIDGNTDGDYTSRSTTYTNPNSFNSWWQVDLGANRSVERVILHNRTNAHSDRLSNFTISVLDDSGTVLASQPYHTGEGSVGDSLTWDLLAPVVARTIRVSLNGQNLTGNGALHLAEVQVMGSASGAGSMTPLGYLTNWTQESGVSASQSATSAGGVASRAIDDDINGVYTNGSVTYTNVNQGETWWQVDLGVERPVNRIAIFNRTDKHMTRLSNFRVVLLDDADVEVVAESFYELEGSVSYELKWDVPVGSVARKVRVESLGLNREGSQILNLAEVQVLGTEFLVPGAILAREVIPVGAIESFAYDVDDQDDDDLFDAWEQTYGFDTTMRQSGDYAYGADSDLDYLTNAQESDLGLDPFQQNSLQGSLTLEHRYDIPSYSVRGAALEFDKIYGPADDIYFVESSTTGEVRAGQFAQRMRGYILAPETGMYRFWLSASNAAQLLLSTGEDKFSKRIIAELGPEVGTGHGQFFNAPNKWDEFVSQMSEEIHLVAGQKYFIEVLHQHGHGSSPHADVAWARPNADREEIPATHFYSYYAIAADADDDSLLDTWESQYGLSIADNGLTDRAHEGENGDFDEDGLNNREEYIAGTDPANADTDGDGLSDGDELRGYGTDPLTSDAPAETVVSTVDITGFTTTDYNWTLADGGLISDNFRGSISWDFNIPSSGTWVIQVDTRIRGTVYANESVPVNASIDGEFIGRYVLQYGASHHGIMRILSQDLPAGNHSLTLDFDNLMGRRMVQVDGISLRQPSGLDHNGNGIPDWVEVELAESDYVESHASTSQTSPFCLEGNARIRESLALSGATVEAGRDSNHWYANLALNDGQTTSYTADFANGQQLSGSVTWVETDVIVSGDITLRKGDALRLTGIPDWNKNPQSIKVTLTVNGTVIASNYKAANPEVYSFDTAGTHLVRVDCTHGNKSAFNEIIVTAMEATLPDDTDVVQNSLAYFNLEDALADRSLYYEAGEGLGLGEFEEVDSANYRFRLFPTEGGQLGVVARLWEGGPILDVGDINSITITDALQNNLSTAFPSGEFPGYFLVSTPMVVLDLPPGGKVVVTIFRAGVIFTDGSLEKTFYNEDLVNGVAYLEFLMPTELGGGYCHYLDIYDADGNLLSRR